MFSFRRTLSIRSRLYFIVIIMGFLICLELLMLWFTIDALSSVRAFVGGEGLWSKAQKDAAFSINKYAGSHNEADYMAFANFLKVPQGDKKARIALLSHPLDYPTAYQGFVEGRNPDSDIDGMIKLISRFHNIYYINKAVHIWTQGDTVIAAISDKAGLMHQLISSGHYDDAQIKALNNDISELNLKVTVLEDNFSYTLGEGSRWLESLVLKILFLTAITVELAGLMMSILLSRGITRSIRAITIASDEVMKGNYGARARIISNDEIGQLAAQFNAMTITLDHKIEELRREEQKREELLRDVGATNHELRSFAYVVSHDLKSPLRGIVTIADWLKKDYAEKLDKQGREYLDLLISRTTRMDDLINGILQYSRASSKTDKALVDSTVVLQEVRDLLSPPANVKIDIQGRFPVVKFEKTKLIQVFQNLIGNAIKYNDKPECIIQIRSVEKGNYWEFSVADNGPGIEKKYFEKIFQIFQTLEDREISDSTGIGLSIVKKIVENNDGKVWLESAPGQGTTFHFTVPNESV